MVESIEEFEVFETVEEIVLPAPGFGDAYLVPEPELGNIEISPHLFLRGCTATQEAELPHISSTPGQRAVQGHGFWRNINCPAGTRARVRTWLERRPSGAGSRWSRVGTRGDEVVFAGGGRGRRATGRFPCRGTALGVFRTVTDVDLVGFLDSPGVRLSRERLIACS